MKRNLFETFMESIESFPLWVRECICESLAANICQSLSEDAACTNHTEIFALYSPILTYNGRLELSEHKCGWDSNIYNFLQYCEENFSIADISLNSYFSLEEAAKYFIFCIEQGYLEQPLSKKIDAMALFLSGKIRIGEYFVKTGIITEEQLQDVLSQIEKSDRKIGTLLLQKGCISDKDLKYAVTLKNEAKTRFVLDCTAKQNSLRTIDYTQSERDELSVLKDENKKLKSKLERLLSLVKKDDDEE